MKGVYFINDQIQLNGLSKEESLLLQKQSLIKVIKNNEIQVFALNPYQLNNYYTVLHALLYDLKSVGAQMDCFAYYSQTVLEDFIYSYPARWLLIKSYFDKLIPAIDEDTSKDLLFTA
ncbi:MAG: hypothetical protein ACQEXB_14180 [Bacillota bacterium]